ncbi:glycosidase [Pseudoroseomonas rhizosphaerae]|uniref:Glycosidase n=2 Tax=Teichococcus rhizosphaerae TaxID=1335062 RepID=A0A2C7AGA5_9PROT|nr:glycosidase [Pseudoroseomonas rhizosphaerae]
MRQQAMRQRNGEGRAAGVGARGPRPWRRLLPPGLAAPVLAVPLLAGLAAAPALAPAAQAAPLGVYGANDASLVREFEDWLGCKVEHLMIFTGQRTWDEIGKPQWFIQQFHSYDLPALWSVAMIPKNSSLREAASGRYNRYYTDAARELARTKPFPDGTIRVRLGWEMNGDWFPWAAEGKEADFVATFRHIVDSFRAVSDKFRFEWNINYGQTMDPAKAYPGDDYVDIIGMDFYWKKQYLPSDPVRAFEAIRDDRYGLRYIENFARQRNKPTAYSEWGVQGDDAGPFIQRFQEWVSRHNVLYTNYWNHDADYAGKISGNIWPRTGAAFRQAFCAPGASARTVPPTPGRASR